MPLIPIADVHAVAKAAVAAGLAAQRDLLVSSIDAGYVAGLKINPAPLAQTIMDLGQMNHDGQLVSGEVPLREWLATAELHATLTGKADAAEVFRAASAEVALAVHLTAAPPGVELQRVVHRDDMVPFSFFEQGIVAGRSVARLEVARVRGGAPWMNTLGTTRIVEFGTGWLIADNMLMTCHHVINARPYGDVAADSDLKEQAEGMTVLFDFDSDNAAGEAFAVTELLCWDATLDYAMVQLSACPRPALRVRNQAIAVSPADPAPVNIIQHPRGRSKQLGIRNNLLAEADAAALKYFTDTEAGSSGSPICDDLWRVIGMHQRAEMERRDFQGKPTAWINAGVPIGAVLAHLATNAPALHAKLA